MGLAKKVVDKAVRVWKGSRAVYFDARAMPVLEKACLFEAGQGKNVNGNMFALARELSWNSDFEGFEAYFVTTEDTEKLAGERLARYGISARTVDRESDEYMVLLARCKYLFTDNSFPPYFHKRPDQVYVNTWHGTPLKQLGRSNIDNSIVSFANVQKNMLSADVLLFPNELTKRCFFDDYMLEKLFAGRYVMADYPRNDALIDPAIRQVVREREKVADRRVVAYMPTWRGSSRRADIHAQVRDIEQVFAEVDRLLSDEVVLYVNLHFLLSDTIDYSKYTHIRQFPADYETYDFLAACDALITDYSSVFFDFAVTGREIILYPYDRDEYLSEVGTYLPYEDLPFPVAESAAELAEMIRSGNPTEYGSFVEEYCAYHNGHSARDLLGMICLGRENAVLKENEAHEPVNLRYVSDFRDGVVAATVAEEIAKSWPDNGYLVFNVRNRLANIQFLKALPDEVAFLGATTVHNLTPIQRKVRDFARKSVVVSRLSREWFKSHYQTEFDRIFPGIDVEGVLLYNPSGDYLMSVLGSVKGDKVAQIRRNTVMRVRNRKALRCAISEGGYHAERASELQPGYCSYPLRRTLYNASSSINLLTRNSRIDDTSISLRGFAYVRAPRTVKSRDMSFTLKSGKMVGRLRQVVRVGERRLMRYRISIFKRDIPTLLMNNIVYFRYTANNGAGARVATRYSVFGNKRGSIRHGRLFIDADTGTTAYFRRSGKNMLQVTARDTNPLDDPSNRVKFVLAYLLSKVSPRNDAIVLFEKMSSRYEESASVVYERLIDEGYENVWFILDDAYERKGEIPERYRSHLVSRNSLEHYRLFFSAKTFIGSEMLSHSIELHSESKLVRKRLEDGKANYVFLQHGVMYMVSLDSASRKFFGAPKMESGKYRTVTSSELEKQHFTDLARYDDEMLYVCGLPKFDRNEWDGDADLITVMPTWRPWEANAARIDFRATGYYQLLENIVSCIPRSLKDKVVVLPHPLFKEYAASEDFPLKDYVNESDTYDSILQHTKVLITDYSSIAYDAFYRGANVVFYWVDKESCMRRYGARTKLMIDASTAFGQVSYTQGDLSKAIDTAYSQPQDPEYVERYEKIVEFHDGNNTDRLIKMMRDDGII